jgi:hypothetical protein
LLKIRLLELIGEQVQPRLFKFYGHRAGGFAAVNSY